MSYNFSVFYVKDPASPAWLDELRAQFRRVEEAGDGWIALSMGDSLHPEEAFGEGRDDPARLASAALSARYGEAIFLYADSSADEMIYDHARGGAPLRKLHWTSDGCACAWSCVAGTPEPWEEALFADRLLQAQLDCVDEDEQDEVRAAYASRQIQPEARWPSCDATVADLIERHFGITRPPKKQRTS